METKNMNGYTLTIRKVGGSTIISVEEKPKPKNK